MVCKGVGIMSILLQMLKSDGYQPLAVSEGTLEAKRLKALEWLGDRWIYHPNYVYNPRHRIYR